MNPRLGLRPCRQPDRFPALVGGAVKRNQRRQPAQPEARGLGLVVAEHPRLDDLIRLAEQRRHDRHGVLETDAGNVRGAAPAFHPERCAGVIAAVLLLGREVPCAADRGIRAGEVEDADVPREIDHVEHVALVVGSGRFGRQKVRRKGFMPMRQERIADGAGEFARN